MTWSETFVLDLRLCELIKGAVSGNLAKNRHGEVSTELSKKKKIVTEEGLNIWLCIIENKRVHDSLNWD